MIRYLLIASGFPPGGSDPYTTHKTEKKTTHIRRNSAQNNIKTQNTQNRKETTIYIRRNSAQNNTKTQNTQNIEQNIQRITLL
jgi:hypothetical protein